jgi:anaerobic ribonucleoside-triphosphate reductase activating protein
MLKYYNYDIVFQEIPDKVTLAINLSCCPNRCKGCHSPWLREDVGEELNEKTLDNIISKYINAINCVCFMGGDNNPKEIESLAKHIHNNYSNKTVGWYSGKDSLSQEVNQNNFNYIKIGSYKEEFGSLKNNKTNQRLYKIASNGDKEDITFKFWKK